MTKQQVEQLYKTVEEYSVVKKAHIKEVHGALAWAERYGVPYWDLNQIIKDLDRDLFSTPERQAFIDIVEESKTDNVVERHLTEAFSQYFLRN
ncbi:hypothetical protein [Hymenobacter fodinae]|uniref:Uncharacterized protein n=1 Tax=Hymenobacter fodinae TaxID=2510796 RepID=A0A4Z0P1I3_9BACT|nr:hypothetical protein [Hymenobacter fodinae]TGE04600.1 hypothetical protein EU556_20665 [Hymenobacter fodinae]